MHEEEELPPANADVNNGLEYPPPSAFLKHILKGKTDPTEVMQLTSMYFREYDNQPSKYGSDYSMVSRISSKSGKSTSKSRSPECFYGRPADHGYPAKSWIFTFQLYLAAEDEHNPVAKAATYLRGDALDWWQQSGYVSMPPDADFEQFTSAFLKRFVKPADSAKARRELPLLRQEGQSVETYAAKFNNMNNRITEGTAIDSTTLAVYFQQGFARRISTALVNSQSIATMQDLALVMAAAEEIESKLDLSAKQATQVEVPATGNSSSAKRVRYGDNKGGGNANASFNNISTNNRGGGRGPFTAGRGNAARGRGTVVGVVAGVPPLASHLRPVAGVPPLASHLSQCLMKICTAPHAMPLGMPNGPARLLIASDRRLASSQNIGGHWCQPLLRFTVLCRASRRPSKTVPALAQAS
ncbi:TPA: hypothetical protein ACH3X1_013655 [Trebouxia sp. C0004]